MSETPKTGFLTSGLIFSIGTVHVMVDKIMRNKDSEG